MEVTSSNLKQNNAVNPEMIRVWYKDTNAACITVSMTKKHLQRLQAFAMKAMGAISLSAGWQMDVKYPHHYNSF